MTTRRDAGYTALVLLPVGLLVLLLVTAVIQWRRLETEIEPALKRIVDAQTASAPSPLASRYDAATATDQTVAFRSILSAATDVNARYSHLLNHLTDRGMDRAQGLAVDPNDIEITFKNQLQQYAADNRPVLAALRQIDFAEAFPWFPLEFGNPPVAWSDLNKTLELNQMLRTCAVAAVVRGDFEQMIELIRQCDAMYGRPIPPHLLVWEHRRLTALDGGIHQLVGWAMRYDGWTDTQLEELDAILDGSLNLRGGWNEAVVAETLWKTPWLRGAQNPDELSRPPTPLGSAPSRRLAVLEAYRQLERAPSDDASRWLPRDDDFARLGITMLVRGRSSDRLVEFPGLSQPQSRNISEFRGLASAMATVLNNRRHARTAVAIKRYRRQFGRFPRRIEQLRQVGLPAEQSRFLFGGPFHLVSVRDGDEVTVTLSNVPASSDETGSLDETVSQPDAPFRIMPRYAIIR